VTIASISAILAEVASRVVLFSTDSCAFCEHARSLLTKRGVAFEEVDLGPHPELQAELAEVTGLTSFPQVVVDGEPLGGLNELRAADTRGALAAWGGDRTSGGR
jgi:glutaredoxin 3